MIYFAQFPNGSIKIGHTTQLEQRLLSLKNHYKSELTLLATQEGDREREKEVHKRFHGVRLKTTEQFKPSPELMRFIGLEPDPSIDWQSVEAVPPIYIAGYEGPVGHIAITFDAENFARLKKAAKLAGLNISSYSRMTILQKAREVLQIAKEE